MNAAARWWMHTTMGWLVVLCGMAGTLMLARAASAPNTARTAVALPAEVENANPSAQSKHSSHEFLGVIVASESVDVAARADGWLEEISVRLGDQVQKGAVIARLDDRTLRAQLARAHAALAAARANMQKATLEEQAAETRLARREWMSQSGPTILSREELENARYEARYARLAAASARGLVAERQAEVDGLDNQLSYAVLRAPFTGVVAARYVDTGATVAPGTAIIRLVSGGEPWVRFLVPVEQAQRVSRGMTVFARMAATSNSRAEEAGQARAEHVLSGVVETVAPEVDAASGMIVVEARMSSTPANIDALTGRVARVTVAECMDPKLFSPSCWQYPGRARAGHSVPAGGPVLDLEPRARGQVPEQVSSGTP